MFRKINAGIITDGIAIKKSYVIILKGIKTILVCKPDDGLRQSPSQFGSREVGINMQYFSFCFLCADEIATLYYNKKEKNDQYSGNTLQAQIWSLVRRSDKIHPYI